VRHECGTFRPSTKKPIGKTFALREAEWHRQQAEERAKNAETRAALYEELEKIAAELTRSKKEIELAKERRGNGQSRQERVCANMSHEIRTPMNGIIGMAELLLNTKLAPEQREYLHMVKQSADALLQLLNDILDFSKIEAGKMTLEAIDFDLRELRRRHGASPGCARREKGLELALQVAPDVPEGLVGDPGRLRQILVNLIGNAIKFTGSRRSRRQRQQAAGSRQRAAGGSGEGSGCLLPAACCLLHFAVRDTGVGIPADKQQLIFDAFSQADSSTSRRFGGTGLGLSISSQLVAMQGGRIWVESESRQGEHVSLCRAIRIARERRPHGGNLAEPWRLAGAHCGRQRDQPADSAGTCCGVEREKRRCRQRRRGPRGTGAGARSGRAVSLDLAGLHDARTERA